MLKIINSSILVVALAFATLTAPTFVTAPSYISEISAAYAQTKKEIRAGKATTLALPDETTYANVEMQNRRFEDALGQPHPDFITADLDIVFNGDLSGNVTTGVTYAAGASKAQVQTAVRNKVNEVLAQSEPGNTLNNARIILGGLSD